MLAEKVKSRCGCIETPATRDLLGDLYSIHFKNSTYAHVTTQPFRFYAFAHVRLCLRQSAANLALYWGPVDRILSA